MSEKTDGRDQAFTQSSVPEAYDAFMGAVLFEPWGQMLVDFAGIDAGAKVLDVACGTGIVTRLAALRAGPRGHCTGVDISGPMLHIARAKPELQSAAPIDFLEGSAFTLPSADGSQDVVLCHQGLPFLPDRAAALREMHRVATKGGTVAAAVWSTERPLGLFGPMIDAIAQIVAEPPFPNAYDPTSFTMTHEALRRAFEEAGFAEVKIDTREREIVFDSLDAVVRTVEGTPYGPMIAKLSPERQAQVRDALAERFRPSVAGDDTVRLTTVAHLARATR